MEKNEYWKEVDVMRAEALGYTGAQMRIPGGRVFVKSAQTGEHTVDKPRVAPSTPGDHGIVFRLYDKGGKVVEVGPGDEIIFLA